MSFPRSRAPVKYAGARRTKGTTVPYSSYLPQLERTGKAYNGLSLAVPSVARCCKSVTGVEMKKSWCSMFATDPKSSVLPAKPHHFEEVQKLGHVKFRICLAFVVVAQFV